MERIDILVKDAKHIVVVQADNPDGDSLASGLALEHILGDMGKEVSLFCGVDIPTYLRYMKGWDRVSRDLPTNFDLSIIVDTSSQLLLETLDKSKRLSWISSKPCIVLDHHQTPSTISFATVHHAPKAVATTEVICELATKFEWPLNGEARKLIVSGILSDSLGLTTEDVSARDIHIIGEMVEAGVNLAELDNDRRSLQKKSKELLAYKGELLRRIEYNEDGRIAIIFIPWKEIEKYSHAYNPSMLVIDEMRQVEGVNIALAFKVYPDGRITCKIRSNYGWPISAKLAEHFGGGGHRYASGFRVTDGRTYEKVKDEAVKLATELLDEAIS